MNWFKSYLNNRKLRVKINDTKSNEYKVEYGMPQGSCLRPLIFLIFCNDLNLHLTHMQCIQFADDTTLYLGHPNQTQLKKMIEYDLETLQDWFRANKLTLNVEKSVCLVFNENMSKNDDMNLTMSGQKIPLQKETKFLGVWIDNNLKWDRHATEIINRIKLRQCLLKCGVNFLTTHAKMVLFFAQMQCIFSYGIGAWGNMINQSQCIKLQKTQNQCVRLIEQAQNAEEVRKKYNILSINELTTLENYKLWYKEQPGILLKQM